MIGIGNDVPKLQSVSATCLFISENTALIPTPLLPAFLAPVPGAFSLKSEPAGGGGGGGGPPPGGLGAALAGAGPAEHAFDLCLLQTFSANYTKPGATPSSREFSMWCEWLVCTQIPRLIASAHCQP